MSKKEKTFEEVFGKIKTDEVFTWPGKFEKAIVIHKYNSTISFGRDEGDTLTIYSNYNDTWKDHENLKRLDDFNLDDFLNESIDNMVTFEGLVPKIKEVTKNYTPIHKFIVSNDIKKGKLGILSNVEHKIELPYIEVEYLFDRTQQSKEKCFKNLITKDSSERFLEEFGMSGIISELKLSNIDKKCREVSKIMTENTFMSKKLRKIISNLECNEELKTYLLEGKFNKDMQFVHVTPEKTISFTPKNKMTIYNEYGYITEKNRQEMRPHRFFNKVFKDVDVASEYEIKCFTDNCMAALDAYHIEYVDGSEIGQYYTQIDTDDWYTDSCMDCVDRNYFEIYADNKFELGIIRRNDEIVGRFLKVHADDGFTYNDRLYHLDNEVLAWYNAYVDTNNLIRRETSNGLTGFYQKSKGEFKEHVTLTLVKPITDYDCLPYVDTIRNVGKKYLSLNNWNNLGVCLESTDGEYEGMDYDWDEYGDRFEDEDYMVLIDEGEYSGTKTHFNNCNQTENGYILK